MRAIKFRAWDPIKNIMIDDADQNVQKHYDVQIGDWIHDTVWRIGKLNGTLMQFTGLKDRKNVEIYEGDIVLIPSIYMEDGDSSRDNKISKIIFHQACFKFEFDNMVWTFDEVEDDYGSEEFEIIGNVYQNKELLEMQE